MSAEAEFEQLSIAGHTVTITHPGKLYFSRQARLTKLDIVRYHLGVAEGALRSRTRQTPTAPVAKRL